MAVDDIVQEAHTQHVVITGGEPTMYDLDGLLVPLQANGHFVQLETSGQNGIKGLVQPDWITWSPKENLDFDAEFNIKMKAMEVKWVLDESLPYDTVWSLFKWYISKAEDETVIPYFVLMPEGCPPRPEMVAIALEWLADLPDWAQVFWRYGDRIQYRIGVD
jgi:organic radical activating enzyme